MAVPEWEIPLKMETELIPSPKPGLFQATKNYSGCGDVQIVGTKKLGRFGLENQGKSAENPEILGKKNQGIMGFR